MTELAVDVVVNNHNYARYLPAAITSALEQTHEHVRVIVVDDGSTDGSRDVIRDYGDQVVALVHEYRRGKGSGVTVEADIALVYGFREGKVVRIEPYMSQVDALEAAGLSG